MATTMKRAFSVPALAMALVLSGCAGGLFDGDRQSPPSTGTSVVLSSGNYSVVKAGATGESRGLWILFVPIRSPNYAEAQEDLLRSVGQPLAGKPIALANESADHSFFTLLLFSIPEIKVTADVVQFAGHGSAAAESNLPATAGSGGSTPPSASVPECGQPGSYRGCNAKAPMSGG